MLSSLCLSPAPQAGELTEADMLADIPIVVSATRLPQPLSEAPVSMTVIDRQLIDASGAIEVYDLLRLVPGMQVGMTFRHHIAGFSYHGQSDGLSRRMQLLVDGRVAQGSQLGITDWDRLGITVQDIERIEVVRGPVGATYGSEAFIGVINIITREAATDPAVAMAAAVGSTDLQQVNLRHSFSSLTHDYQLGLGYFTTDGFDGINDQVKVGSIRFKSRHQLTDTGSLDLLLGHAEGPSGRGGGAIPVLDPVGEMRINESYLALRWNQQSNASSDWYLQFNYNRNRTDDRTPAGTLSDYYDGPLPPGYQDEPVIAGIYDFHAERLDIEFKNSLRPAANSRLVWGGGARKNRMKGVLAMQGPDYYTDYSGRLYGNWEQRAGRWLFNAGTLFEDGDLASGNISYRLGGNYDLGDQQMLRVSYAEGMRSPTMGEAHNGIGMKTLSGKVIEAFVGFQSVQQPEEISSYELGYLGGWLEGRLSVDFKLFREQLGNEISEVYDPSVAELAPLEFLNQPGAYKRLNAGETTLTGAEINLDYQPWQGARAWLGYSYVSVDQTSITGALRDQHGPDATPRHTASLSLSQQFARGWQASLNYYYMSAMAWQVWGTDLNAYDRLDARLAKQFTLGSHHARIELMGQNLFGASYNEFSINNSFERRAFVRFSLQFD